MSRITKVRASSPGMPKAQLATGGDLDWPGIVSVYRLLTVIGSGMEMGQELQELQELRLVMLMGRAAPGTCARARR